MARSLFDAVDLRRLREAATGRPGAAGLVLSCLLEGRVLQHDPLDPEWVDRDRLVVGLDGFVQAADHALAEAGYSAGTGRVAVGGGQALATAYGLAAASRLDGGVYRVYCLLPGGVLDDGPGWEAAVAAGDQAVTTLTAFLVAADRNRAKGLLEAVGWAVQVAEPDPVALLGALDRLLAAPVRPGAVAVVEK